MSQESIGPFKNTNREIWRERPDDFYAPSIFVNEQGGIGISVGGHVITRTVREWHNLAAPGRRMVIKTKSHPEANGRKPLKGEEAFTVHFVDEHGRKVSVSSGRDGLIQHAATIVRMLQDDPILNREVEDAAETTRTT